MPKGTRKCKVCGREYPYCQSAQYGGAFRYQDVACCQEHGATYLAMVMEARGLKLQEEPAAHQDVHPEVQPEVQPEPKKNKKKKVVDFVESAQEEEMA